MICQNRHLYVHDADGTQCITAAADRIASVQEESVAGGEHLIKDAAGAASSQLPTDQGGTTA